MIHHSLIQLYVSVPFLLAPTMWNGHMQPDTKLICPIGIIVVLSDFGQVHITVRRKWHTVAQELKQAPAGQLLLWGQYYIQLQHSCSSFYVFKSCKEFCDGLYHTFLISVNNGMSKIKFYYGDRELFVIFMKILKHWSAFNMAIPYIARDQSHW